MIEEEEGSFGSGGFAGTAGNGLSGARGVVRMNDLKDRTGRSIP